MLSAAISSTPGPQNVSCSSDESFANLTGACALLALMVQTQAITANGSKSDVELDWKKMEELKKQLADAVQHAKDAANDSGFFGFLGDILGSDIAQIAGAVAAAAAVVATGGAAAGPLLLIALSEGLQVAAKYGPELGLDPKLCMALGIASVAVGLCTGTGGAQAASALSDGARAVELGAHVTQGLATGTGGALHFVSGHYQAKSLDYKADAAGYQANSEATDLDFGSALDLLQRVLKTSQREMATVGAINEDNNDTNVALANRI